MYALGSSDREIQYKDFWASASIVTFTGTMMSGEIWRSSQKDIITLSCYISLVVHAWCNMGTDCQEC